jgi:serine/threonine-protein kinase
VVELAGERAAPMNVTPSVEVCPRCGRPDHGAGAFECSAPSSMGKNALQVPSIGAGLQVGDYRIEEAVGAGGMGVVYRAVQPSTGKTVAVKVLTSAQARDANAVRRFVLEIRAVNEIRHPNLVEIYSFGQLNDGRYYYVMEYLDGCSLGALMRSRGRLSPEEVLPVFLDVLAALEAAHAKGILHRDLKPDNVFLLRAHDDEAGAMSKDGKPARAKLLDFGLAKLMETSKTGPAPLTAAGMAVGTPQYMAPEQCRAKKLDGRADLYALGVMLYEALTGKLPCDGRSTLEIWEAHVRRIPQRPIELCPGIISPELDSIIMTLLAKSPEERFSSAAAVTAALAGEMNRRPSGVADLGHSIPSGASASQVARALPSSIHTMDLVPIDGVAGPPPDQGGASAPAAVRPPPVQALRELFKDDLDISEVELDTADPKQVSVLDIDLGMLRSEKAPAWASSSARLPRLGRMSSSPAPLAPGRASAGKSGGMPPVTARRPTSAGGIPVKYLLFLAVAVGAAILAVLFLR